MPLSSSISTRLHYQHKSLVDMIDGLSDEMIRRPVMPGKWSIFEHMVHLQTFQHTFIARIKQLLRWETHHFPGILLKAIRCLQTIAIKLYGK